MEIHYKRDLNSNYMILTDEGTKKETHEVRMITENRIYGFLPCVSQKHETSTEYYYEITGYQSMELLYERRKLKCSQLKEFFKRTFADFRSSTGVSFRTGTSGPKAGVYISAHQI